MTDEEKLDNLIADAEMMVRTALVIMERDPSKNTRGRRNKLDGIRQIIDREILKHNIKG